jgi:hypothetical protein
MDRASKLPLSVAEAKLRLRNSAEAASPSTYVRHHPYAVLGVALTAGFLLGKKNRLSLKLFTLPMLNVLWAIKKFI